MYKKMIEESVQGNAYSLGRLITFLEDEEKRVQIIKEIEPYTGNAFVLGITGPPGAGKSTLISRLIAHLRELGFTLGLLCVDPTSPFSGGALLGDRLRMEEHSLDPGVFIRSLSAQDRLGGISPTTREAIKLLDAAGKDIIIVESAGVGQSQLDVKRIADTVLVVFVPGMGDSIQMLKAGLMEIADIFVLNMADREGADKTVQELKDAASRYMSAWKPLVVSTVATGNEGIAELYQAVVSHREFLKESGLFDQLRRERSQDQTMELVQELLKKEVNRSLEENAMLQQLLEKAKYGSVDPYSAARQIVEKILRP